MEEENDFWESPKIKRAAAIIVALSVVVMFFCAFAKDGVLSFGYDKNMILIIDTDDIEAELYGNVIKE